MIILQITISGTIIKVEDLLRKDKSFERSVKLIGENLIKGRQRKNYISVA